MLYQSLSKNGKPSKKAETTIRSPSIFTPETKVREKNDRELNPFSSQGGIEEKGQ